MICRQDSAADMTGRGVWPRRTSMTKLSGGDSKSTLYCSFCGKSQHEVRKLIAGPTVFICDECVELCNDIIREETKSALVKTRDGVPTPAEICKRARRLCDRPEPRQARPLGRGPQSLQAPRPRRQGRRGRARQVEHPARRPDRLRQDPARPDPGAASSTCPSPWPTRRRSPKPAMSARMSRTSS